ncbi:LutC/YkgG family protein [Sphingobacterium prati]|uniref:LutC/YkgG family protein n=1 Tax=Sphingobacterium prati TaxID=2737006 RepID=UPI001552C758|nr:LUD domain-containing protein [Sphingobacterium prati]NPE45342.1 LUD domain-containing protein [Sphingobacterium prati]
MSDLHQLLGDIRKHLPKEKIVYPQVPTFTKIKDKAVLKQQFIDALALVGGVCHDVSDIAECQQIMRDKLGEVAIICSATAEWEGNKTITDVAHPRDLDDVDLGIIRAEFGVAEMGMVWLTENSLKINSLGFLSQHLAVLLDPDAITENMHTAYQQIDFNASEYGCFVMGPSATADIGATLVRGAQGPRSLTLFFLKTPVPDQ